MGKIKEKLIKDWKFFVILSMAILLILLMSFYALKISDKVYKTSEKVETGHYIQDIKSGSKIEQKIIAKENNFQRLDIQFESKKGKTNVAGEVTIGINNDSGEIITQQTITRNYIREKETFEFEFKKQKQSQGKEYTLWIQFENIEQEKELFSIKTLDKTIGEETYIINGEVQNGSLAIQEFYVSSVKQIFFIGIAILFTIYAFSISTFIYYKKGIKPEKIFLYTVPVICLFYIFCMPTFKNHDELYHWYRGYEVSIGKFMTGIEGDVLGTEMPDSIRKAGTEDWTKITYGKVGEYFNLRLDKEKQSNIYAETSAVYSFVQYLPQGIGIALTRLFTDKVLFLAYGGRLANMIVALTCIYFAIKKIPFGKKILLLLSYIPIAIEGFSSLSPDAMTISIAFFFVAYILSLSFRKEKQFINKKQILFLGIISIIMALCKIVYLPMVLLLFIIPKDKFKNEKKCIPIIIIVCIAVLINLAWLGISSIYLSYFREGDSSIQINSILLHPITYFQNCLYTLNLNTSSFITTMFGQKLGWGELVNVHSIVPYTLFVMAIWSTISDNTIKEKFKDYQKWIIVLTVLAIVALIFTSLYVQWTSCESDSIAGIQGRYFIPILPLIMLLIGSMLKINTEYKEENMIKLISIIGTVLQLIVVLQIVIYHL